MSTTGLPAPATPAGPAVGGVDAPRPRHAGAELALSPADAEKRSALRRMKLVATGLLVLATLVYLLCRWLETRGETAAWIGFVRAASEAGMVGALADWFAVTALFRHPLGLPIPHTAIIRRKKDQLGDSLSGFVGENFFNAELITQRVRAADIPRRAGRWLSVPENADRVSQEAGRVVSMSLDIVRDGDVEQLLNQAILRAAQSSEWGPPLGRLLQGQIDQGKHHAFIDILARRAHQWAVNAGPTIETIIERDAPSWAPNFVNDLLGSRIHKELVNWTLKVATDQGHEARHAMSRFLVDLAHDLQHDEKLRGQVEDWKRRALGSEEAAEVAAQVWAMSKRSLTEAAGDAQSPLRTKVSDMVRRVGVRLDTDDELRGKVEDYLTRTAAHVANNYSGEVTSIISETVKCWDADDASRKIELQVGRDLQFIRINGTVVGALAGLVIYTISEVLFHL